MIRLFLLVFSILLFTCTQSLAVQVRATWDQYTDTVDGFTVWERVEAGKVETVTVAPDAVDASWNIENEAICHTYFLTAFRGDLHSGASNTAVWCPQEELPPLTVKPGQAIQFKIEVIE